MTDIIIPSLSFLSGICAYASFNHLSAGLRRAFNLTQISFALMCLALALYALYSIVKFYKRKTLRGHVCGFYGEAILFESKARKQAHNKLCNCFRNAALGQLSK